MDKKYYKAYEDRYKQVHEKTGMAWAGDRPSFILKNLFEKYNATNKSSILEVGCGEGQNALYLLEQGYNVKASDVSAEAVKWCREKAKEKKLPENNFYVLDIIDNNNCEKYDYIYSISTVHMLVPDEDRKAFFDFIYSHLNDNGFAIITSMGDGLTERNNSDITKAYELSERLFDNKPIQVASTSCRIVNWKTISKEIENSKLQIVEKFISTEISGFNNSMVMILKK